MAQSKMTKEDMEWRAKADAHTMVEYQAILSDPARKKRAMAAAQKEANSLEKGMNAMKQAAGIKTTSKKTKKK